MDKKTGLKINFRTLAILWLAALLLTLTPLTVMAAPDQQSGQWLGEFFNNKTLSGSPTVTRGDSKLDFNWGTGAPAPGIPADNFSARWTRTEWFDSGTYRFYARSDDGLRLWVGDHLVIDAWEDRQAGWTTRDAYIGQGSYYVRVEYYEHEGGAQVTLNWERLTEGYGWQAEYYANQSLSGAPAVRRTDSTIDFNWGNGSPATTIPEDHFSVRWVHTLGFSAGKYRFLTSTDDGVRLWVDGRLVVDAWYNQSLPNTRWGDVDLSEGLHQIKVEYYEDGGEAHAHVWWQRLGGGFLGWKGEYFDNRDLVGGPVLTRDDSEINFDWGTGSPASWMPHDNFSARWTRQLAFDPGYYRLSVRSDDGVRVWLDGGLIIDKWQEMNKELHYVDGVYLSGAHQLKLEYFELGGYARIQFWISPNKAPDPLVPSAPPTTAPGTVIVDDGGLGFVAGGSASGWRTVYEGQGGRLTWTRNNDWKRPNYNWARWYPTLSPGHYEVFVFIPERYTTTSNANYWVVHSGEYTLREVDQSVNSDRWVSLGTYWFDGSGNEYTSLNDVTHEPRLSRYIGFDAVMWVPR